jgi:serine/threonine-protein kinase RsbT
MMRLAGAEPCAATNPSNAPLCPARQTRIPIRCETDLARARATVRRLARDLDFTKDEQLILRTVVSELVRNILAHAGSGEIRLAAVEERRGLEVVASDDGPGIDDAERAHDRGVGLAAVRRLMDELSVRSRPGAGTTVACTRWVDRGVSGHSAA